MALFWKKQWVMNEKGWFSGSKYNRSKCLLKQFNAQIVPQTWTPGSNTSTWHGMPLQGIQWSQGSFSPGSLYGSLSHKHPMLGSPSTIKQVNQQVLHGYKCSRGKHPSLSFTPSLPTWIYSCWWKFISTSSGHWEGERIGGNIWLPINVSGAFKRKGWGTEQRIIFYVSCYQKCENKMRATLEDIQVLMWKYNIFCP